MVNTPVLALQVGPVNEVLSSPELQIVDTVRGAIERLKQWRLRRPTVTGNPRFLSAAVAQRWLALFYPNVKLMPRYATPKQRKKTKAEPREISSARSRRGKNGPGADASDVKAESQTDSPQSAPSRSWHRAQQSSAEANSEERAGSRRQSLRREKKKTDEL
jgi:hypothetical protein